MTEAIETGADDSNERRRVERRTNARIGDLTLPEVRRILITTMLGAVVLVLFLWMVRSVVIAAILGADHRLLHPAAVSAGCCGRSATATLVGDPHAARRDPARAARARVQLQRAVGRRGLRRARIRRRSSRRWTRRCSALPFLGARASADRAGQDGRSTRRRTARGCRSPCASALAGFSVAATIFLFTAFYILIEAENDRRVSREQDSAAVRRAAPRARGERARRAVRRDLLHAADADDEDR